MKVINSLALCFTFFLVGCGGGGGSGQNKEIVLGEVYQEQAGDEFTTFTSTKFILAGGSSERNVISTVRRTLSLVDSIPSKYNYSRSTNGPFILAMSTREGLLRGLNYGRMSGGTIINDDLTNFKNIEYSNRTGSGYSENVFVGDKFSTHANETLFSSISGDEVGYEIRSSSFTVLKEEQLTVPAGVFNAVKFRYNVDKITSINDSIDTTFMQGYMWRDIENGFMLKSEVTNATMIRGDLDLTVKFSGETVLKSYSLAEGSSAKRNEAGMVRANQSGLNVNPSEVFDQINANLELNAKEIFEEKK